MSSQRSDLPASIAEIFMRPGKREIDLRRAAAEQLVGQTFDAFDLACDMRDVEAAQDLLTAAEGIMARNGLPVRTDQDKTAQLLVDSHFRLWELRYLLR